MFAGDRRNDASALPVADGADDPVSYTHLDVYKRQPINWAQDISLLAFAWLTFIGADIVAKTGNLIRIDMLEKYFPKGIRKVLTLVFDVAIVLFLVILIVYGFLLVSQSWYRTFQTMKMSYAWCTLSVPVGSVLLFFTMGAKLFTDFKTPVEKWGEN